MPYRYGYEFGLRCESGPWPYTGRGRGGPPRCWYAGTRVPYGGPWSVPYRATPTREEELGSLQAQAEILKHQLDDVESRIQELQKNE